MVTNLRKKILLSIFCLASIFQGMYSTYFVSILTTIERMYQIQSKTAGAILSATEIGQISGSLLIAYYGGRGNKPKWISACMALSAIAALASITPHFIFFNHNTGRHNNIINSNTPANLLISTTLPYPTSDPVTSELTTPSSLPTPLMSHHEPIDLSQLCLVDNMIEPTVMNSTQNPIINLSTVSSLNAAVIQHEHQSHSLVLVIFFICLLAIGFGSTAVTTLGIPFIDDIVSKEESPLYLGLTIGLKIFGPALGFLLGSFCINLNLNINTLDDLIRHNATSSPSSMSSNTIVGAWWLGLVLISLPLLILALPMYIISRMIECNDNQSDDFADITYQAAEDHDIGGSHDFQSHILGLDGGISVSGVGGNGGGDGGGDGGDLGDDQTSNRTCYSSEINSSSREVLQASQQSVNSPTRHKQYYQYSNYGRNISLEQPILTTSDSIIKTKSVLSTCDSSLDSPSGVDFGDNHHDGDEQQQQQAPLSPPSTHHQNNSRDLVDNATSNWRSGICVVVNRFGGLESTNFTNDEITSLHNRSPQTTSSRTSIVPSVPSYTTNKASTKDQLQQQQQQQSTISDLSNTLSRLIKNRLLLLRMLSGILHILPIAGFYTFVPKYLIEQFRITTSSASAISGLAGILFVGLGAFLGGTIVRLFNVNSRLMTRWIAASALLYTIGMLILMNLGCPQNQTVHYNSLDYKFTDCLTTCKCLDQVYNPVCANGTTYLSPCLAGCRSYTISGGRILFDECGCSASPTSSSDMMIVAPMSSILNSTMSTNSTTTTTTADDKSETNNGQKQRQNDNHINLNVATQGHCLIECDNLKWYIIVFSISTLIHASCEVGSMMFNLRCVRSGDRALALGLTTFSSSLLGLIPCSVIYGTMVDFTCVHWSSVAPASLGASGGGDDDGGQSSHGACQAYENDSFRYYLHSITAFVMFLAFLIDCVISKRANEVDFYDGNDSRTDIRMELKKSTETI